MAKGDNVNILYVYVCVVLVSTGMAWGIYKYIMLLEYKQDVGWFLAAFTRLDVAPRRSCGEIRKFKPCFALMLVVCGAMVWSTSMFMATVEFATNRMKDVEVDMAKLIEVVSPDEVMRYGGSIVRRTVVTKDTSSALNVGLRAVVVRVISKNRSGVYNVSTCHAIASENVEIGTDVEFTYVSMRDSSYRPFMLIIATRAEETGVAKVD